MSKHFAAAGGGRAARSVARRPGRPGALGIVDRWADRLLAGAPTRITPGDVAGARL